MERMRKRVTVNMNERPLKRKDSTAAIECITYFEQAYSLFRIHKSAFVLLFHIFHKKTYPCHYKTRLAYLVMMFKAWAHHYVVSMRFETRRMILHNRHCDHQGHWENLDLLVRRVNSVSLLIYVMGYETEVQKPVKHTDSFLKYSYGYRSK